MEYDLTKWYQPIENGDKIKFTYLKSPNPIGNNAIAFDGKLPEEFKLHKYVDYEMQYEKTFLNAIKGITSVIGDCQPAGVYGCHAMATSGRQSGANSHRITRCGRTWCPNGYCDGAKQHRTGCVGPTD